MGNYWSLINVNGNVEYYILKVDEINLLTHKNILVSPIDVTVCVVETYCASMAQLEIINKMIVIKFLHRDIHRDN